MTNPPTTRPRGAESEETRGTLYLLCGLAFSGKSTLAAALAQRLGAKVVSLDEINARRDLWGGDGVAEEEWAATHHQALREVEDPMRRGAPHVVVDDTNCFRFLRDDYRTLAAEHGYRVRILVLRPPLEEIHRRRYQAAKDASRRGIGSRVFDDLVASFEWPGEDESPLPVPWQHNPSTWIDPLLLVEET